MGDTNLISRYTTRIPVREQVENKQCIKQYKQSVFKNLQIGDILEGILVEKTKSGYVLELDSGIRIPVSVLKDIPLGKLLKWRVQDIKQNGIQVEISRETPKELTKKVIEELKLNPSESMEQCIEQFVGKNLSLTREGLLHTHYLYKHYKIPSEVIINILAKNSGLTEKDARVLVNLREQGIGSSIATLEKILNQIKSTKELQDIANILLKNMSKKIKVNILKDLINDSIMLKTEEVRETVSQDRINTLIEEVLGTSQSEDAIHIKNDGYPLIKLLRSFGIENKDEIKWMVNKLYKEITSVSTKSSGKVLKEKIENITSKLEEMSRYIEKNSIDNKHSEVIGQLKEGIEVLHKLNKQGEYFMVPILAQETLSKGEIYFYRPNKKQTKQSKSTYIVIALDLSALQHLEVHIHKVDNNINLEIEVAAEEIKQYIAKHIDKLGYEIVALGYKLGQCSYRISEEQTVKSQPKQLIPSMSVMDLKI